MHTPLITVDRKPDIAMVVGEASGEILACDLIKDLQYQANFIMSGIGGEAMRQMGFDAWYESKQLSVIGYADALKRLPKLLHIRKKVRERLIEYPPKVFVGIDAPDFNLDLERALKEKKIPSIHYICPSIWAWRAHRVHKIKRSVDHVLCVFPFEPALLAKHGIPATFVGHPLAHQISMQTDKQLAKSALKITLSAKVIAILPGSRTGEILHLAQDFFDAAFLMYQTDASLRFIVPCIEHLQSLVVNIAQKSQAAALYEQGVLQIISGQSHQVLQACEVALVASGTATLEAALFKKPMVIAYKVGALSYHMMRSKSLLPWIGLPNILCNQSIVPELIQHDANPKALANAMLNWLDHPYLIQKVNDQFTALHDSLRCKEAGKAAQVVQGFM